MKGDMSKSIKEGCITITVKEHDDDPVSKTRKRSGSVSPARTKGDGSPTRSPAQTRGDESATRSPAL